MRRLAVHESSLLPEQEKGICIRLREVRIGLEMDQKKFSERLGISVLRLKSYEYARAPIRYEVARELIREFGINQRWLATGEPPTQPPFILPTVIADAIPGRTLYSIAFERALQPLFPWQQIYGGRKSGFYNIPEGSRKRKEMAVSIVETAFDCIPDTALYAFLSELKIFAKEFAKKHAEKLEEMHPALVRKLKSSKPEDIRRHVLSLLRGERGLLQTADISSTGA